MHSAANGRLSEDNETPCHSLKLSITRRWCRHLKEKFNYTNPMQIPKIEKIVINMGLGEAIHNIKIIDSAVEELRQISGQQPVVTRAKKSIAAF
jgi:ribosomal protein L5